MNKMRLIGFCGFARSGQDTAASAALDAGWTRAAFADALKQEALYAIRISLVAAGHNPPKDLDTLFTDPATKELYRPFLVEYGRTLRKLDPDHWVRRLHRELEPGYRYAITDVRYANEVEYIPREGGLVLEIVRPDVGPANEEEKNSMQLVKADFLIRNDGTVDQLRKRVLEHLI